MTPIITHEVNLCADKEILPAFIWYKQGILLSVSLKNIKVLDNRNKNIVRSCINNLFSSISDVLEMNG